MDNPFDNVIAFFELIDAELDRLGEQFIKSPEIEELMIQLNREQLADGLRSDGSFIEPEYQLTTVSRKRKLGQRYDVVTLRDRGDWQAQFEVEHYNGAAEIVSRNYKDEALQRKYGALIEGLTIEHIDDVRVVMLPKFQQEVRENLNLIK